MQRYGSSLDAVMAVARRVGAAGFSTADITGYSPKAVDNCCRRMVEHGSLFKAKVGHRTVRYFTELSWCVDFTRDHTAAAPNVSLRAARAMWAPPEKGVIAPTEGITARTKFTRCQSPTTSLRTSTHEDSNL